MNLGVLEEIAGLFANFKMINYIARIDDNLIILRLDSMDFYIDLNKSQSSIFCSKKPILPARKYNAPFDFALQKYFLKAQILACQIDGNNRILRIMATKKLQYKTLVSTLQLEFTGKYTNAIILNEEKIILESLRKLAQNSRIVKNGIILLDLKQPEIAPKRQKINNILEFLHKNYELTLEKNLAKLKSRALKSLEKNVKKLHILLENLATKENLIEESNKYFELGNALQNAARYEILDNEIKIIDFNNKTQFFQINFSNPRINLINESFNIAKKLRSKANNIELQKQNLEQNIAFLEAKINMIKNASDESSIKILFPPKIARQKQEKHQKFESFFIDEFKICVGRNERENIALLESARANDIWLHIKNIPSSHMIIKCAKARLPEPILQKCAEILVGLANFKSGNFVVDYTKRKFVKIKLGANVSYNNYSSLQIKK